MKNDCLALCRSTAGVRNQSRHTVVPAVAVWALAGCRAGLFTSTSAFGNIICPWSSPGKQPVWHHQPADRRFTQFGHRGGTFSMTSPLRPTASSYGIINTTSLVTLNTSNGEVMSSVNSTWRHRALALPPTAPLRGHQGALYNINPVTGRRDPGGHFHNSIIGNSGQNIRLGYDGNLYDPTAE